MQALEAQTHLSRVSRSVATPSRCPSASLTALIAKRAIGSSTKGTTVVYLEVVFMLLYLVLGGLELVSRQLVGKLNVETDVAVAVTSAGRGAGSRRGLGVGRRRAGRRGAGSEAIVL